MKTAGGMSETAKLTLHSVMICWSMERFTEWSDNIRCEMHRRIYHALHDVHFAAKMPRHFWIWKTDCSELYKKVLKSRKKQQALKNKKRYNNCEKWFRYSKEQMRLFHNHIIVFYPRSSIHEEECCNGDRTSVLWWGQGRCFSTQGKIGGIRQCSMRSGISI